MKEILLTNDDGFDSLGLRALQEALSGLGRVVVVAPAREKSACGHGLNISAPLFLHQVEPDYYKLDDGSPTDCIYLALTKLYHARKPDLIVSGINIGCNMGEDVTYSGTVAGAMEGAMHGVPSMAISQLVSKDGALPDSYELAKRVARELAGKILQESPLPPRRLLNVNIPIGAESKGYKITELGVRIYNDHVVESINPRGKRYYWLGMDTLEWQERGESGRDLHGRKACADSGLDSGGESCADSYVDSGRESGGLGECVEELCSDFSAVMSGYVSITPLDVNLTSYQDMRALRQWL